MVRRHRRSSFVPGAYVFPGGKLDPGDAAPSLVERCIGRSAQQAAEALGEVDPIQSVALYIAGIRETFEEAGVLLAEASDQTKLESARSRLQQDASFEGIADELDLKLDLGSLTPQARWITPVVEPRRYDTRFFFAAVAPEQEATHDQLETIAGEWLTPAAAIDRNTKGEIELPPPTHRTLQLLSDFKTSTAALKDAASRKPPSIMPVFQSVDGVGVLALPGDELHPDKDSPFAGPTRFVLDHGRWRSEG